MLILRPLKNRPIAWIWGGQVFSAVGDEISKVALVWFVAGIIGNKTGYISAMQAAAIFVFSLVGGFIAQRWDARRTMITVDVLRGIAVLAIPVSIWGIGVNLPTIVFLSIIISGLTAFFDPSLKALLPSMIEDRDELHAANGLMETTGRLGRIIGPGLIGIIGNAIPLVQYFVVDAMTYFVSAWAVFQAPDLKAKTRISTERQTQAIRGDQLVQFILYTNTVVNGSWYLVFPLTITLLLHEKMPDNVGALGMIVAAYGVGNVLSNIIVANYRMANATPWGFNGRILVGIGFLGIGFAPDLNWMMISAAVAATGGPMNDLSFLAIVQRRYSSRDITDIFRRNLTLTYGALLVYLLLSPSIFEITKFTTVILFSGSVMIAVGILGHLLFFKEKR
jgi:MFS transporter, DHA3 family, macrolide efflux protein